jgi:invasion protein IalB
MGARGACVPSGGAVVVHTAKGKATSLGVNFGASRTLEGDIRVQIDQGDPIMFPPGPCYAAGCTGKLDIDDQFVERLKHSQKITIEATDASHRKLSFSFPLGGFAETFDGPGTEPSVYEEIVSEEKMKERMQREEEQKKALECKE